MQNVIIFYFSGTGNTKRIAKLYVEELNKRGVCAAAQDIARTDTVDLSGYDAVGIGYPVYGFNTPTIVLDFARKLPLGEDKTAFIIKTSGEPLSLNDASSEALISALNGRGYNVQAEHYYVMPYNMVFRHSDAMAAKMLDTAKERIPLRVESLIAGEKRLIETNIKAKIMSNVCKIEHWGLKMNGKFYKVNAQKCIGCGKCVRDCPQGNIKEVGGKIKFGGDCIGCARCAFRCPADAISTGFLGFLKVNGVYDFTADKDAAVIGRYCRKSYEAYFAGSTKRDGN